MKDMTLNKIIKSRAKKERKDLTARYDKQALKELKYNLKHKPLTLLEFITLADIYDVEYSVTLTTKHIDMYHISVVEKEDFNINMIEEFIITTFPEAKIMYDPFMTLEEIKNSLSIYSTTIEIK